MHSNPDICHVCGMAADPEVGSVEYHKMFFWFCSDQCRETFQKNPALYASKLPDKQPQVIKDRTLHLAEPPPREVDDLLTSYLKDLMGVKEAFIEGDRLRIRYDLMQVTEAQIEKALKEAGLKLDESWRERLRRSWMQNTEEIELENLSSKPSSCCNRPPPGRSE